MVRALHSTYRDWKSLDVFDPLKRLAYDLLKVRGIDIQSRPDGAGYVDVPFTPTTMPSLEEQAAFLSGKPRSKPA